MCNSVIYHYQGHERKTQFSDPNALLPVKSKQQGVLLLPWGRRTHQSGQLPLGGWARHASIQSGRWDPYFPKPVRLPIDQFLSEDVMHATRWYRLTRGQWIQGLLAQVGEEKRIYIVTLTPEAPDSLYDRWPRILLDYRAN
jgi:hypothetical protein